MRLGICIGADRADEAMAAGFDYIEAAGHPLARGERYTELPVEACNQFFPWGFRMWDDLEGARDHAMRMIEGAYEAGIGALVVGSGMARDAREGEDPRAVELKFADFCGWMTSIADRNDVTVAPEPLNRRECQVGWDYARLSTALASRGCAHTADSYHILSEAPDSLDWAELVPLKPSHVHISDRSRGLARGDDPELIGFLRRLKALGYRGRASFEGHWEGPLSGLKERLAGLLAQA